MQISKFAQINLNNCYVDKRQNRIHSDNCSKTSHNIVSILSKYRNIGIQPISFGANPSTEIAQEVLNTLFRYRRPINNIEAPEAMSVFSSIWTPKVESYVQAGKPIEMMIAAFPFKSLSRKKCVSEHADMAEAVCIGHLSNILNEIKATYSPGGRLHIFSDGHIFSGIEGNPSDEMAILYANELRTIIAQNNPEGSINLVTLEDIYGDDVIDSRNKILLEHAQTFKQIRDKVISDSVMANDFCGIKRFIYEELCGIDNYSELSNSKKQKLSKDLAYQTIQASEAWTSFLRLRLPEAIRLSCHPQNYDSPNKIGVWLGKSKDNWLTPWMGVAVKLGDNDYTLMQNSQTQQLGLRLVKTGDGRPSHYEIPEGVNIGSVLNIKNA